MHNQPATNPWIYAVPAAVLCGVLTVVFYAFNASFLCLLPAAILLLALCIYRMDWAYLALGFFAPLSLSFPLINGSAELSMPFEPMLIFMFALMIGNLFFTKKINDKQLFKPLNLLIIAYIVWLFVCALFSPLPLVAFKSALSKTWIIVPSYFIALQIFENKKNTRYFLKSVVISMCLVVFYSIIHAFTLDFSFLQFTGAMTPIFREHTSYGAVLAFMIPISVYLAFNNQGYRKEKIFFSITTIILTIGLLLSYSRAAWLSLLFASGIYLLVRFKIKFKWIVLSLVLLCGIGITARYELKHFSTTSANKGSLNVVQHLQSSFSSTNPSNLERTNRWKSGLSMVKERPLLGHGSGTFQFLYGPYQNAFDKTEASTNYGNIGTLHNEYLAPLVDLGIVGFLLLNGIFIVIIYIGIHKYKQTKSVEIRGISLAVLLAFSTYFLHGFVNNFLEIEKVSFIFFACAAILTAKEKFPTDN